MDESSIIAIVLFSIGAFLLITTVIMATSVIGMELRSLYTPLSILIWLTPVILGLAALVFGIAFALR